MVAQVVQYATLGSTTQHSTIFVVWNIYTTAIFLIPTKMLLRLTAGLTTPPFAGEETIAILRP